MSVTPQVEALHQDLNLAGIQNCLAGIALIKAGIINTYALGEPADINTVVLTPANAAGIEQSIMQGFGARYPGLVTPEVHFTDKTKTAANL